MALQVYNTLTRKKELFEPIHQGRVGIYVCGPTVYGPTHIGHAKSYVSFDVIVRYLRYIYGERNVLYVQNLTDVGHILDSGEDRVLKGAAPGDLLIEGPTKFYLVINLQAARGLRVNITESLRRQADHLIQ